MLRVALNVLRARNPLDGHHRWTRVQVHRAKRAERRLPGSGTPSCLRRYPLKRSIASNLDETERTHDYRQPPSLQALGDLGVLATAQLMVVLDVTIVNIALPS